MPKKSAEKTMSRRLQEELALVANASGAQAPSYLTCLNHFREHGYEEAKRLMLARMKL